MAPISTIGAFEMALMSAYKHQMALISANGAIIAFDATLLALISDYKHHFGIALISAIQFMFLCGTFAQ